jgi:hypothetical protein
MDSELKGGGFLADSLFLRDYNASIGNGSLSGFPDVFPSAPINVTPFNPFKERSFTYPTRKDGVITTAVLEESSSSSGSGGSGGSGGTSDSGSDKSTAIVPMPWHPKGYGALFTMESNEVLFDFVLRDVPIVGRETKVKIDPRFLHVCEKGSIAVTGAPCGPEPYPVGASVDGDTLTLSAYARKDRRPSKVTLKLTGVRRGFAGYDMPERSKAQFDANEKFLNSAYPAE